MRQFPRIGKEEALKVLKNYVDEDCLTKIGNFVDLRSLASVVLWLTKEFSVDISSISVVEDVESSQPLFVEIGINDCDWEKWVYLAKYTKDTLKREGLGDITGKVVLVCDKSIQIN